MLNSFHLIKNKFCRMLSISVYMVLSACGNGTGDLGDGYKFQYTSSIGQFITSSTTIAIDTVILDYSYDESYIAAVSLESRSYRCSTIKANGEKTNHTLTIFVDNLLFTTIEKKTHTRLRYSSLLEMVSYLEDKGFKGSLIFDISDKDIILKSSPINRIDMKRCTLKPKKY